MDQPNVWGAPSSAAEGAHPSEPVATGAHQAGDWLTVQEAVAYCLSKGLHRTPKTVRKWAVRSIASLSGSAEILVRRQDTENGFRWLIERASLDVKIEQEKEFEHRRQADAETANPSEPVATGRDLSLPVHTGADTETSDRSDANPSEPVPTGGNLSEPTGRDDEMVGFLKKQIDEKDRQLRTKDEQIAAMLERDRETNYLIRGLQTMLSLGAPRERRDDQQGDNAQAPRSPHDVE